MKYFLMFLIFCCHAVLFSAGAYIGVELAINNTQAFLAGAITVIASIAPHLAIEMREDPNA